MGDGFHGIDIGAAEQAVHLVRTATAKNFEPALDELAGIEMLVGGCMADWTGPIRGSIRKLCDGCTADADTLERAVHDIQAVDVWSSPISAIGDGPAPPRIPPADPLRPPTSAAEQIMEAFHAVRASFLVAEGASEAMLRGVFGDLMDADTDELLAWLDEFLQEDRGDDPFAEWDFADLIRRLQWMQLVIDGKAGDPALRDALIEAMDEGTLKRLLDELPALREQARALGLSGEQFDQLVMEPAAAMLAAAGRSSDPSAYTELAAHGYPIIDLMTVAPDYFTDDEIAAAAEGAIGGIPSYYPKSDPDGFLDTAYQALGLLSDRPAAAQIFFASDTDAREQVLTSPNFDVEETANAIHAALVRAPHEAGDIDSYRTGLEIMADISAIVGEGKTLNAAARQAVSHSLAPYIDDIAVGLDGPLERLEAGDGDASHTVTVRDSTESVDFGVNGMVEFMGQLVDDPHAEKALQETLAGYTNDVIDTAGASSGDAVGFHGAIDDGFMRSRNLLAWSHAGFQRRNDGIGDPAWAGFVRGVAKGVEWGVKAAVATEAPQWSAPLDDGADKGQEGLDAVIGWTREDPISPSVDSIDLEAQLKVKSVDAVIGNDDLREDYGLTESDAQLMNEIVHDVREGEISYDEGVSQLGAIARGGGEAGTIDRRLSAILEDLPGFDVSLYVPDD